MRPGAESPPEPFEAAPDVASAAAFEVVEVDFGSEVLLLAVVPATPGPGWVDVLTTVVVPAAPEVLEPSVMTDT